MTTANQPPTSAAVRQVVLVGHCGADGWMLRSFVQRALPGAHVTMVDDQQQLDAYTGKDALLLVNRVLDYGFDSDSGIDLIARLAKKPAAPAMMLVSNYADAQDEAVKAGARRGFGKSELGRAQTAELLREAARL